VNALAVGGHCGAEDTLVVKVELRSVWCVTIMTESKGALAIVVKIRKV